MKKIVLITNLMVFLAGCSALPNWLQQLQPTQLPSPTTLPTNTIPTLPAQTLTATPNLFVITTDTPGPTSTIPTQTPLPTSTATLIPTITLEVIDANLFTPSANMFVSALRTSDRIVWGSHCDGPRSLRFTVQVVKAPKLYYVLLFMRLQDKYSGLGTPWGAGAIMNDNDQGVYFYEITTDHITRYRDFDDA